MNTETLLPLVFPAISYFVGFLSGWFIRDATKQRTANKSSFVLIMVTTVWAISMFVDIVSSTYETSPLVHALMGAIVGFFYKPGTQNNEKN